MSEGAPDASASPVPAEASDDAAGPGPRWSAGVQILITTALLVWRLASILFPASPRAPGASLDLLWQDPVLILSLYWIFTVLASRTRAWKPATLIVMLVLMAGYLRHQFPYALDVLKQVL